MWYIVTYQIINQQNDGPLMQRVYALEAEMAKEYLQELHPEWIILNAIPDNSDMKPSEFQRD